MGAGEFLTRVTVWAALCGYAVGAAMQLVAREDRRHQALARWAWTAGCCALLLHLVCAFHFYHGWSQTSAYLETARQTRAVTGLGWGGGLFINYIFIAAWVADVLLWWRSLEAYRQRPLPLVIAWHGLFLFMVFNATVVFKTGVMRWLGLLLCLGLSLLWWFSRAGRALNRTNHCPTRLAKD